MINICTKDELITQFKDYLKITDKKPLTIKSYEIDIKQFLKWQPDINEIGKTILVDYANHLEKVEVGNDKKRKKIEYMKPTTINRKLNTVKVFIYFLNVEKDYNIKYIKKSLNVSLQAVESYITNKDIKRMLAVCKKKDDIRAEALISGLFYTGARISELLDIEVVHAKDDYISIKGKKDIFRDIYIPRKLKTVFKRYLKSDKRNHKECPYLFTTTHGKMTERTAQNILKKVAGQAKGIPLVNAHPHALRHLYRQNLEKMGIRQTYMSQLMGHTLNIEERYGAVTKKELHDSIAKMDIEKLVKMK